MTFYCGLDFEGRSGANLLKVGGHNYATHHTTQVICCGYTRDKKYYMWWPEWVEDIIKRKTQDPPPWLHRRKGEIYTAWNSAFDRKIWQYVCTNDYGWPDTQIEDWFCTMSQARANGLPGSLANAAKALGITQQKDDKGKELIQALCVPQGARKGFTYIDNPTYIESPEMYEDMIKYCDQDVKTEAGIVPCMRELHPHEMVEFWASEHINDIGIPIDVDFARKAVHYAEAESKVVQKQLTQLTKGAVEKHTQAARAKKWLFDGYEISTDDEGKKQFNKVGETRISPDAIKIMTVYKDGDAKISLDGTIRNNLLEVAKDDGELLSTDALELIEVLDSANKSSIAKYRKMADLSCDGVVYGSYSYAGAASTGRYCVARETLLETAKGQIRIDEIEIGEEVLTHTGMYRKVVAKYLKGREMMYRVDFNHGGHVVCTANHRILYRGEWKNVCQFNAFKRSEINKKSDGVLSFGRIPNDTRCGRSFSDNLSHRFKGDKNTDTGGGAESAPWCKSLSRENRQEKPDVWCSVGEGNSAGGVSCKILPRKRRLRTRTSEGNDGNVEFESVARGVGSSPHQRRQTRQPPRQFSVSDEKRPSIHTQFKIKSIVPVGIRTVWDITVEKDHSYVSGGVAHHNSAKGVQTHNLGRKCVDDWASSKQALADGMSDTDAIQTLSKMLRGTIQPEFDGYEFYWADLSNIEARVLPWLCDTSTSKAVLDKIIDADETEHLPKGHPDKQDDIYVANARAMGLFDISLPEGVTPRDLGKVAVLSLGFGGAKGALIRMAKNYGIILDADWADRLVKLWRRANSWAEPFWAQVKNAAWNALENEGQKFKAGKLTYFYTSGTHNGKGTLWCQLPCKRLLAYIDPRIERVPCPWDADQEMDELTALKAAFKPQAGDTEWPRYKVWYGVLVENAVQATAASCLRYALAQGVKEGNNDRFIRLHTHDEILCEANHNAGPWLVDLLTKNPPWATGLPLAADYKRGVYYGK